MDATKGSIYKILDGNKQFIIPIYQRYYSWDIGQCERLWQDIIAMQNTGKSGHFVGSIVSIAEQTNPTLVQQYMVIDGQQRLTTLTLLLVALRNYAINHPEDSTISAGKIDNVLLKNAYEHGDNRYKLILTDTDKAVLINLIECKPIKESEQSKIISNYNYFATQIDKMTLKPAEIYEAIGKLQIVDITLDRATDDAQAIFESLNSTGKELSESDLIRNYVLMGLDKNEQTYIYERIWRPMELLFEYQKQSTVMDGFFRDYLTMKSTRIPRMDRVYTEFRLYHINCEFKSVRELCEDLYAYAVYYTNIVFSRSEESSLIPMYKDINSLKMEVAYPFLLKIHHDYKNGLISINELKEIMQLCISYVLRRSICNIPTNSLNKTFATLKNDIHVADYLNSVKAFFILREDYKEFPSDSHFKEAFIAKDIYNMRTRHFILSSLENFENKEPISMVNCSIEHIMPQNSNLCNEWRASLGANWKEVQKKYLHTIGNLTLTAYNSEMSDKPFVEKLVVFNDSALRLNAYVRKQTDWNEHNIQERAQLLADKAAKIWSFPNLSESELTLYKEVNESTPKYNANTYDMNVFTKTLFEALDKRILNLSPDVRREFKKLYIAYKLDTNFVDVVVQKQRLRISVNMNFSEVYDPLGICKDITNLGRWGNGNVELFLEHMNDIDKVMPVIEQAYNIQAD